MSQIKTGAVLNYVIIFLNIILGLCYTPFMLRCLGQNEYGLYSLVASIIAYLTLLDFGFGPTVIRYTSRYRAEGKVKEQYSLFGTFVSLYSILGAIAFCLGLILYFNVESMFDRTMTPDDIYAAKVMIMLLLFNMAFSFPFSVFGSIIAAYEHFVFQKSAMICRTVLCTAVMICLLIYGYKAIAMVVVQTVFNIGLLLSNLIYCRRVLNVRIVFGRLNWSFVRQLLGFSVWVFLGDLMFKFYYSTGQFVLGATSGTVAVAVFALAVTFMQMYIVFSTGISGVLLPKLSAMVANNSSDHEIADLFVRVGRLQFFVLSVILSGFVVFGKSFIEFWAGPGYDDVYVISIIFFFTTLIPLIQNTAINILMARNQQRFRSLMLVAVGAISLGAQVLLAREYGAIGCAVAVGVANLVGQGLILNYYYHKYQRLEIDRFWKEIAKMMVVPVMLTCIGVWVYGIAPAESFKSLMIWIIGYCVVFLPLMFRFGLYKDERNLVLIPMKKLWGKIGKSCVFDGC